MLEDAKMLAAITKGTDRLVAVCPRDFIMVCHRSGIVPQDAAGVIGFACGPCYILDPAYCLLYVYIDNTTPTSVFE